MTATPPAPPNPFEQLGLPPTWAPTRLGFSFAKLTPVDGPAIHLLIIDGPTGRQAFPFDSEALRQLGERAIEQSSGLKIVSSIDQNGNKP